MPRAAPSAGQGRRVDIGRVAQNRLPAWPIARAAEPRFADLRLVFERQAKRDVLAHGQPRQ